MAPQQSPIAATTDSRKTGPHFETRRICSLVGMDLEGTKSKLITFKQLREGLELALIEARASKNDEKMWSKFLAAAKLVKATTDVIIDVTEKWNPGTKSVKAFYDYGKEFAEGAAASGFSGGIKNVRTKAAESAAKSAVKLRYGDEAKDAFDEVKARVKLVNSSINGELDSSRIYQHVVDTHLSIGEKVSSGPVKKIWASARAINAYGFEMYRIYHEWEKGNRSAKEDGYVRTLESQLTKIVEKIDILEKEIRNCEEPELQRLLLGDSIARATPRTC